MWLISREKRTMEKAIKRMIDHLNMLGKYPNLSLQFNIIDLETSWYILTGEDGKVLKFSEGKLENPLFELTGFSEDLYNVLTGRTPLSGELKPDVQRVEINSSSRANINELYRRYSDIFELDP